ncbi:chemotaxis protein [Solemya velum gill symbiont]|uniref:chemotaxis protein n=1 Tax=Solemya velum gill symbiont TaxID=2340 RepID=UPI000996167D|nr:chemotaxis protein [Solemya velum gill symbiont]
MMRDYLVAMLALPLLFLVWVVVQWITRQYAMRHPEFGPPREEGSGCGSSCQYGSGGSYKKQK